MPFKHIAWLLLTALLALELAALAGCGPGEPTNAELTTAATEGESETSATLNERLAKSDGLPQRDYGGYTFRIYNTTREGGMFWAFPEINIENQTGEALNDAMYLRNRNIEERFNIVFAPETTTKEFWDIKGKVRKNIMSGSDDYDMVMMFTDQAISAAVEGLTLPMGDLPLVDLSQPWWDQNAYRDMTLNGKCYVGYGDFGLTMYDLSPVIMFNKKLISDLSLENPYQLVRDKKWTYDKFAEMARANIRDINSDGVFGLEDSWGFLSVSHVVLPIFTGSFNQRFVKLDSTGYPYLATAEAGFVDVFEKVLDLRKIDGMFLNMDDNTDKTDTEGETYRAVWKDDRALFYVEVANWVTKYRMMETDFGILPPPMANEAQGQYYSPVGGCLGATIPITASDLERTSVILEALAAESYKTVVPVYYDITLKTKSSRDNESSEMLDIIFSTRFYDLGNNLWGGTCVTPYNELIKAKKGEVISETEKIIPKAEKEIAKAMKGIFS